MAVLKFNGNIRDERPLWGSRFDAYRVYHKKDIPTRYTDVRTTRIS